MGVYNILRFNIIYIIYMNSIKLSKLESHDIKIELCSSIYLHIPYTDQLGNIYRSTLSRLNDSTISFNKKHYSLLYLLKYGRYKIKNIYTATKRYIKKPKHHTKDYIRMCIVCDADVPYKCITYCLIKSIYILSNILDIECEDDFSIFYKYVIKKIK